MMHISEECEKFIKGKEGCRLNAYKAVPTEKYYTIGWGHYGPEITKDTRITQEEADSMFLHDIIPYEQAVAQQKIMLPMHQCFLTQGQFDALTSFAYNCGKGNLSKLCKGRTPKEISEKILLYDKSGGKQISGLTKRRKAEQAMFLADTFTLQQIAQQVLDDKWGRNSERKRRLTQAGYNYRVVQDKVTEMCRR